MSTINKIKVTFFKYNIIPIDLVCIVVKTSFILAIIGQRKKGTK